MICYYGLLVILFCFGPPWPGGMDWTVAVKCLLDSDLGCSAHAKSNEFRGNRAAFRPTLRVLGSLRVHKLNQNIDVSPWKLLNRQYKGFS